VLRCFLVFVSIFLNITGLDKIQGLSIGTDAEGSTFGSFFNFFCKPFLLRFSFGFAIILVCVINHLFKNFLYIILFIFIIHFVYGVAMFFCNKIYMQSQVESAQIKFDSLADKISVEKGS